MNAADTGSGPSDASSAARTSRTTRSEVAETDKTGKADKAEPAASDPTAGRLNISAIDTEIATELRGLVWWLMATSGIEGMRTYGDVIEAAWRLIGPTYRLMFNATVDEDGRRHGQPFPPAKTLPRGRRKVASDVGKADKADTERLTVIAIDPDVANEIRGMAWVLGEMPLDQRRGLDTLGDIVADLLGRWLPRMRDKYNDGEPFTGATRLPPGRR